MEVDIPWAEAPDFRAEANRNGSNSATMRLHGELDIASAGAARRALEQLDAGIQQIVLDLSDITYIDAAGVRFLLTAQEQARTAGRDLVVRHPSRSVLRVLALTGDLPAICPADPSPDEEPEPADLRRPARANSSPAGAHSGKETVDNASGPFCARAPSTGHTSDITLRDCKSRR